MTEQLWYRLQWCVGVLAAAGRRAKRDDGMTTVEYAVGTLVAAALAAVLYRIVTGQSVIDGLSTLVTKAMTVI